MWTGGANSKLNSISALKSVRDYGGSLPTFYKTFVFNFPLSYICYIGLFLIYYTVLLSLMMSIERN